MKFICPIFAEKLSSSGFIQKRIRLVEQPKGPGSGTAWKSSINETCKSWVQVSIALKKTQPSQKNTTFPFLYYAIRSVKSAWLMAPVIHRKQNPQNAFRT